MALLGPMVVVAEKPATDLVDALGKAGAFPIVEATWIDAPAAIGEIQPAALVLAESDVPSNPKLVQAVAKRVEASSLMMPVIARVRGPGVPTIGSALPVGADEPVSRLIARVRSVLRVRALHATVMRRSEPGARAAKASFATTALLDHATVLCMGRGRSYPALTVAIGERVGLIGAFSVENAARFLNSRDIEGVVIGDGFATKVVEAMLTVLAEDARFRDLPVGVLGNAALDDERLPNLICGESDPNLLVERLMPLIRMQAFEVHLRRLLKSLETEGMLDPDTGLLARDAFWRDLGRAVSEAEDGGRALSVARFSFDDIDRRGSLDAARLLSRLVRNIDFACHEQDGSIIAAFTETDLRAAHVVARRIASVLRHTMLVPDRDTNGIKPTVTLATLKPSDNLSTLVARVGTYPKVTAR